MTGRAVQQRSRWGTRLRGALSGGVLALGLVPGIVLSGASAEGRARVLSAKATPGAAKETAAQWRARHGKRFQRSWGIDIVGVRPVASGMMLRFDYRVLDPAKAAPLAERRSKPYLIDEATRTALAVPAMEKVGELRQVTTLDPNRTYFMIFGNPGGLVKSGSKVTLQVGSFHVEGLVVD
jgi:hypothetical protein